MFVLRTTDLWSVLYFEMNEQQAGRDLAGFEPALSTEVEFLSRLNYEVTLLYGIIHILIPSKNFF